MSISSRICARIEGQLDLTTCMVLAFVKAQFADLPDADQELACTYLLARYVQDAIDLRVLQLSWIARLITARNGATALRKMPESVRHRVLLATAALLAQARQHVSEIYPSLLDGL